MDMPFYLPCFVRVGLLARPYIPRSFQSLMVTRGAEFVKQTCSWPQCARFIDWAVKRLKRAFLLFLCFTAQAFGAGLGSYADLVVSDSPANPPRNGVRVLASL